MPATHISPKIADAEVSERVQAKFIEMFGANGPAVKELLVQAGILDEAQIKALAARWRPSMTFLHAQAQAWKTAQRRALERPAEIVYNAAYESVSRSNPDWQAAGNIIAHAALGRALAGKLPAALTNALTEGWDAVIAPLPPAGTGTTKVSVRSRAAKSDK